MSIDNPYRAPVSEGPHVDMPQDRERLRRIAGAQRLVNVAVLLYLGIIPINVGLRMTGVVASWIGLLVLVYLFVVLVVGVIAVFRLASMFRGTVVALLYLVGMIVPLLGLLLLVSLSGRATKELRAAGINVGLLGANPKTI